MEGFGGSGFNYVSAVMKKQRSATSRRPRPEVQLIMENHDMSYPLNNSRKNSPDENGESDAGFRRKEVYVNNRLPRRSSVNKTRDKTSSKKVKRDDKTSGGFDDGRYGSGCSEGENGPDLKHCSESALTPGNWKSSDKIKESFEMQLKSPDGCLGRSGDGHDMYRPEGAQSLSAENKLRKVKLKVGGVTHTIHARSNLEAGNGGSSTKPPRSSDAFRHYQKLSPQDISNGHSQEKGNGFQGDAWKDSSGLRFSRGAKDDSLREGIPGKQTDKLHGISASEPLRRSKRLPKRHVRDGAFDDGEEDAEICCVKNQKIAKLSKKRNTPCELDENYAISRSNKESRKMPRSGRESNDVDYIEEEEPGSAGGPEAKRKKEKTSVDSPPDVRTEPLTTRQRALQSWKRGNDESVIEFPNGLPPAPSRKQKEKLSDVEIQAKKAEAAQRRRLQVEKAARESEADAIRKILGLDSDKRKEEKKQKEREEKAAKSQELALNNIRWIREPTGTVVTFPEDVGLPCIFSSKPCSYPPPREKCAGPSCTNEYKYRDSKSKLPLCSLQCYRAVQGNA
ncbi:eukaryotic translation initiation factor 5B-like isoform X1 [Phoenix dactylifera]|uniref:Eukaryotic translation initiation factor 5B-like isoform X1 n=1 Tax=Phoenix dactylifera TaxID=42345 RepID=A0A8B7D3P3_PHODC|nr:eukaryotic translation initiation factor 5B-like isoform X1 [Phoenix dactylifera]XP_008812521.2 eukaryotic translation initiation factor 5B-like isoform X1 [Phoenix dactylifera]